jgi:hypothetical protein
VLAITAEEVKPAVSHPNEAAGYLAAPTLPETQHGRGKIPDDFQINARACKGWLVAISLGAATHPNDWSLASCA